MDRNIYLKSVDLEEVEKMYFDYFENKERQTEKIKVIDSLNRITSEPVFAKISSPHYNASAMDGIVVRAKDTYDADETNPVKLKYEKEFLYIDTGDVIPKEFDSVIMIEEVVKIDDETVEIFKAAYPWQDVRPVGEDISIRSYNRLTSYGRRNMGGLAWANIGAPTTRGARSFLSILRSWYK